METGTMPSTRDQIVATVTEIVAGEFGQPAGALTPDLDLTTIEGADSVKVLRSVAKIEQRYDIELEDDDVFGLKRIDDVVNVIEKELGGRERL
jgi:acyl carrier protein